MGSDTSWCIVPSEGTFNNYVRDNNRQFIIYLTDLTDNYSKIGATIGFSFNTAHKKNDRYISEYDLIQLLNARKFDIRNLFQNKDEFLKKNDINRISVNTLLKDVGVSKEFIIKNKKSFTNSDIQNFNQMEIHVYKLNKKIEIKNFNSLKEEAGDTNITNYIIDNLDRIIFKLDMNNILEIQPSPNSLELLYPITYDTTKKEIDSILKYKYNGENLVSKDMSNFTTYKLITTNWEDKESESRKYDIDYLIYTLKICNIYPQNVNKYSIKLPHLKYYDSIKLLKHFIINGYKFTSTEIFNYFSDLISGSYIRTKESDWLSVLESFPEIKDKLRDIIESSIEKVQYYDLELELIDKYYPDIYESAKEHSSIIKQFAEFKRITPYKNYQDADKFFKNIDYKVWIENLYSKYINTKNGGLLKKARLESREQIGLIIIILIKLDKFDEFNEFTNIKWHTWGKSILSYMVRMGLNRVNPTSAPELQLTKSECEKLLNELPKIDIGNILSKHFSLSLVYYIKGWGFNNYLKFIRSVEIKDSESRMYYMKYVLSYLISEDRYSDAKEVVDIVMSWEMSDKEKSKSIEDINSSYFIEIDNNSKSEKIDKWRNYIKKYYK